jgi:hypothetical protein
LRPSGGSNGSRSFCCIYFLLKSCNERPPGHYTPSKPT